MVITDSSSLRPKIFVPVVRVKVERTDNNRTNMVVTFTPPAVEPGAPPININTIERNLLLSLNAPLSTALKPAVRGVTVQKKEFKKLFSETHTGK